MSASPAASLAQPVEWDKCPFHWHSVQFYVEDEFLLDSLSRLIGSSLGAGDAAIVIATKAHRDGLAERLKACGFDVPRAVEQGRYVSLDAAETISKFMVNGVPDALRFHNVLGKLIDRLAGLAKTPVAAFGEMVALLWADGEAEAALRLEQLWNELAQTHTFYLHCAYPMSLFSQTGDSEPIGKVCAEHSHVVPAEGYAALVKEEERLRAVAFLQQKAQALETEVEERKKAQEALERREAELSRRNDELREAVAARDVFLSVAAHELKTPVTSLRGFAQLLLRDARRNGDIPPARLESALEVVNVQSGKLADLVKRLLDTSQIQAGKLRIEPVSTDLVALVRSALSQQQVSAPHVLVFDGPDHLEAMVDPVRFEQVVTNLICNAVKYSPGGGCVTVQLHQDDDGAIQLAVTDEGMGVPPEQREAVFDRFYQAHDDDHLSGMGLGLYITRQIVDLHGGFVRIEEPERSGSRFVVALPPCASGAQESAA